jgi:hypothetical protein
VEAHFVFTGKTGANPLPPFDGVLANRKFLFGWHEGQGYGGVTSGGRYNCQSESTVEAC